MLADGVHYSRILAACDRAPLTTTYREPAVIDRRTSAWRAASTRPGNRQSPIGSRVPPPPSTSTPPCAPLLPNSSIDNRQSAIVNREFVPRTTIPAGPGYCDAHSRPPGRPSSSQSAESVVGQNPTATRRFYRFSRRRRAHGGVRRQHALARAVETGRTHRRHDRRASRAGYAATVGRGYRFEPGKCECAGLVPPVRPNRES